MKLVECRRESEEWWLPGICTQPKKEGMNSDNWLWVRLENLSCRKSHFAFI